MANIYGLSESDRRKIAASLNSTRHMPQRVQGVIVPPQFREPYPREVSWKNYGATTCPPGGVIKIFDYEASSTNASWLLHGNRPNDERGNFYAVNGSSGVASDGIGVCLLYGQAMAKLPDTVVQGDTVYCKTDSWDAADAGTFAIGKVLGSSVTLQVNDSGTSAGLKPILLGFDDPIKQGTAKYNWKKQTPGVGNWPSVTGEIGYVEVDNVLSESDTATTYRVYIPTNNTPVGGAGTFAIGDGDPNVIEDQKVTFVEVPGRTDPLDADLPYYEVIGDGYVSRPIGTVEMFFAESDLYVPNGWVVCDGNQTTTTTATGAAVNMTDYFPWGNNPYSTTNAGGVTIDDVDVAAALADHTHGTVTALAGAGTNAAPDNGTHAHAGSGTDITVTEENSRPKSRGVYFRERIDNAAN
jgi:hypothetical protein